MEVFVRNLPSTMTERQVRQFFEPYCSNIQIRTFGVDKHPNKPFAKLTFIDTLAGNRFLEDYGQTLPGRDGFATVKIKLFHMRRPVNCSKSHNIPDKHLVASLHSQEARRLTKVRNLGLHVGAAEQQAKTQRVFHVSAVFCGQWDYSSGRSVFKSHFPAMRPGRILFGRRAVVVSLNTTDAATPAQQIIMRYDSIESTVTGDFGRGNLSLTFSLSEAPKLYEITESREDAILTSALQNLAILHPGSRVPYSPVNRKRISAFNKAHEAVVGSCWCYRVALSNVHDMRALKALNKIQEIPPSTSCNTGIDISTSFAAEMTKLNNALAGGRYAQVPFGAKFQLQRLAQSAYLPPYKVIHFIDVVVEQSKIVGWAVTTQAIQRMSRRIPFAGPGTDPYSFSMPALAQDLGDSANAIIKEEAYSRGLTQHPEHIAHVYKAIVTPTGIHLYGPEPEMKNRVLRKHSSRIDYFLQVSFLDENKEQIWYDRVTSLQDVYWKQFKGVMQGTINIAGRGFEFLGFSHSSLRAQTCWFMAPFTIDNQLLYARGLIANIGDFSKIRSPAKCAARIGQAFSQTFSSVSLPKDAIRFMPDVKRNDRVFSDGVGTCSMSVLKTIHEAYGQSRILKPTLLQIRFQGAKGMISLDNRIEDHAIYLRPSMVKFEGSPASDIEICGAAFKPLPMYLNRQLIKILEDLGVSEEAFLTLQEDAVEKIRMITESPVNAASFFRRNHVGETARLPSLVRDLWDLGILYTDDSFLKQVLEVSVLAELRELKHRSRIRVDNGMTLYGIMDESGYLQEGQIYCSVHNPGGPLVLTGSAVITRCPALHPGDVQCVDAIDVPLDSPLRALHNCVVFSQHGKRDLPSQLSGGDLDGDLYNVIYDDSLYPQRLAEPADYPIVAAIDIGREVKGTDMADFFIQFMENDALGRIATLHQTLADIHDEGVFHPECVKLAELHSSAVDFSKTGIAVDQTAIPRAPKVKPDFQAPGPRVLMENTIRIEDIEDVENTQEIEELDEYTPSPPRYYPSPKVLGKLYRAIDEHQLFKEIQQTRRLNDHSDPRRSQLDAVWRHIQEKTALIQYQHYLDWARDIKQDYEENLLSIMSDYASQPKHYVSEVEVFCGNLIGKNGAQSKRQRDSSTTMKERFERDVDYITKCILHGEDNSGTDEALERSIACFWVGHQEIKPKVNVGSLLSFAWISAGVCLREVEKFNKNMRKGNLLT